MGSDRLLAATEDGLRPAVEETSSGKAGRYLEHYERDIAGNAYPKGKCQGSYVFLWNQHQEQTHTWFGMFDEQWRESEAVDAMRYQWTGQWPEHRAPRIGHILVDKMDALTNLRLERGSQHLAVLSGVDRQNLTFAWEILSENVKFGYGGHGETKSQPVGGITDPTGPEITFCTPETPAAYRLFVTVYDQHNHLASANILFLVKS